MAGNDFDSDYDFLLSEVFGVHAMVHPLLIEQSHRVMLYRASSLTVATRQKCGVKAQIGQTVVPGHL